MCGLGVLAATSQVSHAQLGESWEEMAITGDNPFPLGSFAATSLGKDRGWIFGGVQDNFVTQQSEFTNKLYQFDVDGNEINFTRLDGTGAVPSSRAFPALGALKHRGRQHVLVFGGGVFDEFGQLTESTDKFLSYCVEDNEWTDLSTLGGPSPRSGATMMIHKKNVYIFGGIESRPFPEFYHTVNDLWKFDFKRGVWDCLWEGDEFDGPRPKHVAYGTSMKNGQLFIYGGERFVPAEFSFPIDQETWAWDIKDEEWRRLQDGPERNYGSFGGSRTAAIMFGGDAPGGDPNCTAPFPQNPSNDLYVYEPEIGWFQVEAENTPDPVKRSAGTVMDGYFYSLGGFEWVCNDDVGLQIWNLKVYRLEFSGLDDDDD